MNELVQRLISGNSSKVLPELVDRKEIGIYDLCITSPPYWNLVKYNAGKGDLSMEKTEDGFYNELKIILKNVWRLLNRYGTLVLQWEDLTVNRPDGRTGEYMLSSINTAAESVGFTLYSRWVWKKFTKKPSVMYSTYDMAQSRLARCNPSWTYAFAYKKDVNAGMSPKKSEITKDEWSKWGADAVWDFPNPGVDHHNTPFAPEFVDRFLKLYTAPGDKILEPFCGSGTTMKQSVLNCRSCTAIELNMSYINKIKSYVGWGNQSIEYKINYVYEDLSKL
jgi:DNA modification methylase